MTTDPIERALSSDEHVVPSSGFSAAVMDLVRREAALPRPIPFPWRRLVLAVAVTGGIAAIVGSSGLADAVAAPVAAAVERASVRVVSWSVETRLCSGALWTAGALAVSFASWGLAVRVAWPRA